MAHIGMLPQSVREEGGYKVKGRSPAGAERLMNDALAVEKAGAFAVVLEIVAADAARQITAALEDSDDRDRLRSALRRTNSGDARSHRIVSVVYAEVCFTRSASRGRNPEGGACIYLSNTKRR